MSNLALKFEDDTAPARRSRKASAARAVGSVADLAADPVLAALAQWRQLKAAVDVARAAYNRAEEAYTSETGGPFQGVTFCGVTMFTLEELEREFRDGALSAHGRQCADAVRLHDELAAARRRLDRACRRHGRAAKERLLTKALEKMWPVERTILQLSPTTAAGARAILDFIAYWLHDNRDFCLAELNEGAFEPVDPSAAIRAALVALNFGNEEARRHA